MTIADFDKNECVGCGSCEQSCPKKAIQLTENNEGFLYPIIDKDVCIECGLCAKKCPIAHDDITVMKNEQQCKILILKDKKLLQQSASGGVFAGVAKKFIENNDVVYGCCYNEKLEAVMCKVENLDALKEFQSSKYVFSKNNDVYISVKKDLETGKNVLFSGRPCQIHGLKCFLGQEYPNLYTMDLVCHGVPSQKLLNKYIEWLGNKYNGNVKTINFRDKRNGGWSENGTVLISTNKRLKLRKLYSVSDPYYCSFLRNQSFRESCYICKYTKITRTGDLTICDFWGIKDSYPEIKVNRGVSACLINTEKGKNLYLELSDVFFEKDCNIDSIIKRNHNLIHPNRRPDIRNTFYAQIDEDNFFETVNYGGKSEEFIYKTKMFLAKICPRFLKKLLRKK